MRGEQVKELKINELNENDTVVLETQHNVYRFRLRSRDHQMGELEGGAVDGPSSAVLGGSMCGDQYVDDRLAVGGRALFFSQPADQRLVKRIVTSPIARIVVESPRRNQAA